jgi:hypothetical protein
MEWVKVKREQGIWPAKKLGRQRWKEEEEKKTVPPLELKRGGCELGHASTYASSSRWLAALSTARRCSTATAMARNREGEEGQLLGYCSSSPFFQLLQITFKFTW